MKIASITGQRTAVLKDMPDPEPKDDYVVVKVLVTPICTEFKGYKAGTASDILGHEAAGEVAQVAQPCRVKPGDRVVVMPQYPCGKCPLCLAGDYIYCRNNRDALAETGNSAGTSTYAQYMVKQDWLLVPIPDDISYEHASMACCGLGPTFGAMQRLCVGAFDTVLITGMGPVGLGGVINGVFRGARVIAVESHPYRANLARELGADAVVDPGDAKALENIMDLTGGRGVDAAIDCAGAAAAQRLMIDSVRRRGRAAFVGASDELTVRIWADMINKGLTLHGCWHFNLADTPAILTVIRKSKKLIDKLITHTFPLREVAHAWEIQCRGDCGKILLKPWI